MTTSNNKKGEMTPPEFDNRMVEWNLRHSVITHDQLNSYLKTLPDEAGNVAHLNIEDGTSHSNGTQE